MLLNALSAKREYGIQTVLDIEKLIIRDGNRIGLVGRNGVEKSTPLDVLSGRIACDEGVIKWYCSTIGILQTRETEDEPETRPLSQLKLRDGAVKNEGEKTRRTAGTAFSNQAPLLLADEPTASLDIEGVELLEKTMRGYKDAILMISHDRTLLDRVYNQIRGPNKGDIRVFDGSYSDWAAQKRRERGFQEFGYQQYQKEKKRPERTTDALQRRSQTMARPPKRMGSSEWMLYGGMTVVQQGHIRSNKIAVTSHLGHLEKKECLDGLPQVSTKLPDAGKIRTKNAAAVRHLIVSYREHIVLDSVNLEMEANRWTLTTDSNGAGKSTLIKTLIDRAPGTFITSKARVTYFSRDLDTLDPKKTTLESVSEDVVHPQHICRAVLSNLYMTKDDVFKPANVLSGGEKAKIALAKVLILGCSFMILDESINHMDMYTMEGLEHLLGSYDGILLAVSRDRILISHVGDMVCQLENGDMQKSTEQ